MWAEGSSPFRIQGLDHSCTLVMVVPTLVKSLKLKGLKLKGIQGAAASLSQGLNCLCCLQSIAQTSEACSGIAKTSEGQGLLHWLSHCSILQNSVPSHEKS